MKLAGLSLYQYRNFSRQEIRFCPGMNLLFGRNGQGKTNLLEAMYMMGYGRSFRTSTPRDCIQHGASEAILECGVEHESITRELGMVLSRAGQKQLLVYRTPVGLGEFIGNFRALAFTQEHLKIVRGGPVERRAFLDRALINAYPGHMQRIAAYGRALKQRNRILADALRHGSKPDRELLTAWDDILVQDGTHVIWNRMRYVDQMREELAEPLNRRETIEIAYRSSGASDRVTEVQQIKNEFIDRLHAARKMDERRGFTTVGPHRDDLEILLNGKALGDFGSAGQQRSCLLALYFAQMEIHFKEQGFYPVFLMDDVEAELDSERLQAFMDHLLPRSQTFLTTAKEQVLPTLPQDSCRFHVQEGGIIQMQ